MGYDAETCTCNNFVKKVIYKFTVDNNTYGKFIEAKVDIYLKASEKFTCAKKTVVSIQTGAIFQNNNFAYQKSANIGYNIGDDLQFGYSFSLPKTMEIDSEIIKIVQVLTPQKFSFGRNSDGSCIHTPTLSKTDFNTNYVDTLKLKFGESLYYSCTAPKTFEELKTFCTTNLMYRDQLYFNLLNGTKYIGIYGNSNPLYLEDWIQISDDVLQQTYEATWVETEGRCTFKFPQLVIYYSAFGMPVKYQYRANYARVYMVDRQWIFNGFSHTTPQNFELFISIQFIEIPNNAKFYKAPALTLDVSIPDDSLYPFYIANSQKLVGQISMIIVCLCFLLF